MESLHLKCIYASTSGNVEAAVEAAADVWTQSGAQVELFRAEQTTIDTILGHDLFLLATSTWEHGALNPFFVPLMKEISQANLQGKRAAFLGLGDSRYEPVLFCEGMEILKRAWTNSGGTAIGIPLKLNGEPYAQLDTKVKPWAQHILSVSTPAQHNDSTHA